MEMLSENLFLGGIIVIVALWGNIISLHMFSYTVQWLFVVSLICTPVVGFDKKKTNNNFHICSLI